MNATAQRPVDRWFASYSGDHQNDTNQLIHVFAVPTILWTVVALLWCIPVFGTWVKSGAWAALAMFAAWMYYYRLSRPLGFGMLAIFIAMVLGIASGAFYRSVYPAEADLKIFAENISILTDIFLRLVKMIIAPLVLSTLIVGVAKLGDLKSVGRIGGRALLVVVDCLRLDQWAMLRPLITNRFDVETAYYFSILPTATPFARNAIFSGLFPAEIKARYPRWWMDNEESSLNAHEAELLTEQLKELTGRQVPVHYEKVFTAADGDGLLRRLPAHLAQDGVTALVFNFIDQLTHGRTENSTLYEVARDTPALRNLTRTWFERSPLWDALREAERRGVPVLLTTDHGSIHCHTPATVYAKRDTTSNLRYKFGDDLRAQEADAALVVDDLPAYGLPARTPGTRLLLATGDRFFVYPTKLREYQARYRGAFLHGGVSPEEVILPIALLTPRHG